MISIVTINFNNLKGLKNTFNSVINQNFSDIEMILVDGLSTDGSVHFLKSKTSFFKKLIIEKDEGIYDAMNKGIKYADGDHLIFLNSGDTFADNGVLSSINFKAHQNKLIFGKSISNGQSYPSKDILDIKNFLKYRLPNHQSMFFPKSFYKKNFYDTSFKIVGDSEYKFRALKNCDYIYINREISSFDLNGISNNYSNFNNYFTILSESFRASKKFKSIDYLIFKLITHTIKFLRQRFWLK